jgi:serine phosphatase RsbU (regulator of sigma subunit)
MEFNKFRAGILLRVSGLFLTLFLSLYSYFVAGYAISGIFLFVLTIALVFELIHFLEKTNRDLARFLNSIQFSDFSQSFIEKKYGSSFRELNEAFSDIIEKFQKTRSETEEHAQYLQTVFKHVNAGLISFYGDGEITLINKAAKNLLKLGDIRNINQLLYISPEFVSALKNIHSGQKILVKINSSDVHLELAVSAAEIKMRGHLYKLISLQDISSELERERLQNEVDIARSVHMRLLPEVYPKIPGYQLTAQCLPALEVGGDYYDFFRLNENKTGIVIADVSGKGLPAAIYMTLTKGIFQSYAGKSFSPRELLIHINEIVYRTIERGSFITMFYAILDHSDNTITYARAGHEPVIFCGGNGKPQLLKPGGMALGLENGEIFSKATIEQKLKLNQGDTLFFYTDGFIDSKNKLNNDFGIENLISVINANKNLKQDEIISRIKSEISSFRQEMPQYDDMTFIALTKINNEKI